MAPFSAWRSTPKLIVLVRSTSSSTLRQNRRTRQRRGGERRRGAAGATETSRRSYQALRSSIKSQFVEILSIFGDFSSKMAPRKRHRLQQRGWDDFGGEAASSGPPLLAPVSTKRQNNATKRAFLELFVETDANKRVPELAPSLMKPSKDLLWTLNPGNNIKE